jgi:hypothetical protein
MAKLNESTFGRKHPRKVLYKDCIFRPFGLQTWPPQAVLVSDWLISKKNSPLKLLGQMKRNLVGRSLEGSL